MTKEQFWENVSKTSDCWLWQRRRTKFGYGELSFEGRHVTAHRLSYELANGPPPAGARVLHRCDNPPCVNPEHLFVGSQADNVKDMDLKGRRRTARGDASGARTRPDRRPRGVRQWNAQLTDEQVMTLRARYDAGASAYEIAGELGVHPDTAWRAATGQQWAHLPGYSARTGRRTGMIHHHAKLDDEKVIEIRRRVAAGEEQEAVGTFFGVSQHCIWSVVHHKTWKRVP